MKEQNNRIGQLSQELAEEKASVSVWDQVPRGKTPKDRLLYLQRLATVSASQKLAVVFLSSYASYKLYPSISYVGVLLCLQSFSVMSQGVLDLKLSSDLAKEGMAIACEGFGLQQLLQ